ncbi:hypothetical protein ACO2Q3_07435 [Caulobacter sp. KR2-114]|uniref:hypothetical protein n=1 Tax=Caulobacter sp. KR2-114 TaxID=3400912 RepID=UPI003BFBB5AB
MKLAFLAAATATLIAAAAPAFADGATTTVALGGNVPGLCGTGHQSGNGLRAAGSDTVALGDLVDANGFLSVADRDIEFDNLWCNTPSTLQMTVTSLSTQGAVSDPTSFVNHLDVIVGNDGNAKLLQTYFGGATSVSSATNGGILTYALPGAFETGTGQYSKASLHITLPQGTVGNDRPIAGDYSGLVTLTATPQ